MNNFSLFGVKEINLVKTLVDKHLEELRIQGYTVLTDVLNDTELAEIRQKIDEVYQVQVREAGSEELLMKINDSNNARALLAYDEKFLTLIAANPKVLEVVKGMLGDYFVLMLQNGIINKPSQSTKPNAWAYHRDLNYQHFTSSRPMSISALFCIDDFTEVTGGTYLLPFTHKFEQCPSEDYIAKNEVASNAKAGSVIVFDSMMYHRSGKNSSPNVRRGINNMYVLPFIKQQISFPGILQGKYSDDPFYNRFLGYESEPDTDVVSFRKKRIARLEK